VRNYPRLIPLTSRLPAILSNILFTSNLYFSLDKIRAFY
jgi:hypothetical protein